MRYTPMSCTLMRYYAPMRCTAVRYTPVRY